MYFGVEAVIVVFFGISHLVPSVKQVGGVLYALVFGVKWCYGTKGIVSLSGKYMEDQYPSSYHSELFRANAIASP